MICPHCHKETQKKPHDPVKHAKLVVLAEMAKKFSINYAAQWEDCTVAALYQRFNRAGIRIKHKEIEIVGKK